EQVTRFFQDLGMIILAGIFTSQDKDVKSSQVDYTKIQSQGTIRKFVVQSGSGPVQNRHEIVSDYLHAGSSEIADRHLIIINVLTRQGFIELHSFGNRETFYHVPVQSGVVHLLLSFSDFLQGPHLSIGNVVKSGDHSCCSGLSYIAEAYGIIGAVPSHRMSKNKVHFSVNLICSEIRIYTPLYALNPPSTGMTVPVIKPDPALMRKCNIPLSSSARPNLWYGVFCTILSPREVREPSGLVSNSLFCSVRKNPGATALTLILSPYLVANSTASHLVKISTAALAIEYPRTRVMTRSADIDE